MPSIVLYLVALIAQPGLPGPWPFGDHAGPAPRARESPARGRLVECPSHLHKPAEDAAEVEEIEEDEQANVSHAEGDEGASPLESTLRETPPPPPPHVALPRSPRGPPAPRD